MLILGLLGMYFDAAVVFVTKSSLLFRLAMAILCRIELIPNVIVFGSPQNIFYLNSQQLTAPQKWQFGINNLA